MESLENALKSLKTLEKGLSEGIEQELVMLRSLNKDIKAEVDSRGFATYSLGKSGLVIATIHNGTYVPEDIHLRQDEQERKDGVDLFVLVPA